MLAPCGQNAECSVQNTLPQRTMICSCLPGYVGDADIACNLRKNDRIRLTKEFQSVFYNIQSKEHINGYIMVKSDLSVLSSD